jgi:predicted DsbA family dithiol-disulfide isomerase
MTTPASAHVYQHHTGDTVAELRIEVWADVICPWCGLANHRLDQALRAFEQRDRITVIHRAFRLDPHASTQPMTVTDLLQQRGMSPAQSRMLNARIEDMAEAEGLSPYIVSDNLVANTTWAHELVAHAATHGLGDAVWRRLLRAHFGQARSVFDIESLVDLAAEAGLEPDEARAALREHRYLPAVEADERRARDLGVTGVPFLRIGAQTISGAQPIQTLVDAIRRAWHHAEIDATTAP